jgi:hypothetical protein
MKASYNEAIVFLRRRAVVTRRWILSLLPAAMIVFLAGCGGSSGTSTTTTQNPELCIAPANQTSCTPPQTSVISINLTVGSSVNLTANVTNDSDNAGVSWVLQCPSSVGPGNCGTLSSPHTASGSPTTYTPPASLTGNSLTGINIVAYSTDYNPANGVASLALSAFGSVLQGPYVLQLQGLASGDPYQYVGVIILDGNGNITSGEQTVNTGLVSTTDTGLTGTYFVGNDGRGTITINDPNPNIGTETFAIVDLSASQLLVSQFDFGAASTGASARGTITQQTSTQTPTGSYAFVVNGGDVADGSDVVGNAPLAIGGVIDIPSGQSAISGIVDEIIAEKQRLSDVAFLSGSQITSGPDSLGKITFSLAGLVDAIHAKHYTAVFTGYIVDSAHIDIIESDTDPTGTAVPFGATGGIAISQTAGSYGNFNMQSFDGTFVFGLTGVDLWQGNTTPFTWTAAGQFTANGSGGVSAGFTDNFMEFDCLQSTCTVGGISGAQISSAFTGTYSVDSAGNTACGATSGTVVNGTGRACFNSINFSTPPNPTFSPTLYFYLTGNQQTPALLLAEGAPGANPNHHYPAVGTGSAYTQSGTAAINGDYGLSFTQQYSDTEYDGTGQMTGNAAAQTLSGVGDSDVSLLDNPFTGTFATPSASAPFAGTLVNNTNFSNVFNPGGNQADQIAVNYYFIDPNDGLFIETDLLNTIPPSTPAQSSGQLSLGYYATRTPVCPTCP